jgi:dihydrofolate reductase
MRKLKIIEHISLDGVIQAPGGPNEDGDYPYGGWMLPYRDPAAGKAVVAAQSEPFDVLLGRRTYDIWSGFWPKAPSSPLADSLNAATKYVTGRTVLNGVRSRALDPTSSRAFAASRRWTGQA